MLGVSILFFDCASIFQKGEDLWDFMYSRADCVYREAAGLCSTFRAVLFSYQLVNCCTLVAVAFYPKHLELAQI